MFKNLKFISLAVLFALLFQLNAFALSDDTSGKQPNGEAIIENEIAPELICPTLPPPTPTAIITPTPSPVDDFGNTFSDACSIESDNKISGNINYYGDVDVFSFVATNESYYIRSSKIFNNSITLYNKSHELIEKTYAYDETVASSFSSYDNSDIVYDNLTIGNTYYLKVEVKKSSSPYGIELRPYKDEYGNTYDSAQIINANTLITGSINYMIRDGKHPNNDYIDVDVFAFTPEASGTYTLDSSFPIYTYRYHPKGLSTHLTLEKLDENSKPIFLEPEIYNYKFVNYDLIKGETYYFTAKMDSYYQFSFNSPLSSSTPTILPTTLPTHTPPPTTPPPTPRTGIKKGDVNDDGLINAVDFAYFRMYLLGKYSPGGESYVLFPYDINCDL